MGNISCKKAFSVNFNYSDDITSRLQSTLDQAALYNMYSKGEYESGLSQQGFELSGSIYMQISTKGMVISLKLTGFPVIWGSS